MLPLLAKGSCSIHMTEVCGIAFLANSAVVGCKKRLASNHDPLCLGRTSVLNTIPGLARNL